MKDKITEKYFNIAVYALFILLNVTFPIVGMIYIFYVRKKEIEKNPNSDKYNTAKIISIIINSAYIIILIIYALMDMISKNSAISQLVSTLRL